LIVGFPGETEADFAATLSLIEEVGLVDSFSFKYSPRPGTKAAELEGQVSEAEAQARLERLQALQHRLRFEAHRARLGETTEILVEGPSRRGGSRMQRGDSGWRACSAYR